MLTALFASVLLADPVLVDGRTGEAVTEAEAITAWAREDVVVLGEEHDNDAGHRWQRNVLERLYAERKDLVLSLEMFERDVQGVLDDYLQGRIDEQTFLERARPWGRYADHYRPLVEFAREHGLDVVAGNVPRRIAQRIAKGEEPTLAEKAFCPRTTTAPHDAYRERFAEVMGGHAGTDADDGSMDRYYRSQCSKDDAMAEAVTDYLTAHPHRRPLVVHVCGSFHSDFGQGTVLRILQRRPLLDVTVVSMQSVDDVPAFEFGDDHRGRAHAILVVPKNPKAAETSATEKPAS